MAGEINKSGAAAMDRAVAELGRSRRQVYTHHRRAPGSGADLFGDVIGDDMSSALVDAILFHDHVQSLAINCTNTQGVKTIVVRILDRKLTVVHLPWRLCQRQLRTS
jgi:hypothetical protein